jgi:hypothetical protein
MAAALTGPFRASPFFVDVRSSSEQNLLVEPRISRETLSSLDDDAFELLRPITITFERTEFGYIASFSEANMAVSGITKHDALQALEVEILDAFEDWMADESALGPGPSQQLAVLKNYISKKR